MTISGIKLTVIILLSKMDASFFVLTLNKNSYIKSKKKGHDLINFRLPTEGNILRGGLESAISLGWTIY
jgi:hypothetical protein